MARKLQPVGGHILVPEWFLDSVQEHELPDSCLRVMLVLCRHAEPDRSVALAQRGIADEAGLARSTAQTAIGDLVRVGALVDLGQSGRSPRSYRISLAKPLSPQQILAAPTRRAKHVGNGWLEAL